MSGLRDALTRVDITYPFRRAPDPMKRQCPAIAYGWCQAPWQCAQPCTGRGGNSARPTSIVEGS